MRFRSPAFLLFFFFGSQGHCASRMPRPYSPPFWTVSIAASFVDPDVNLATQLFAWHFVHIAQAAEWPTTGVIEAGAKASVPVA